MSNSQIKNYDVVIVGGGIVGAALFYVLGRYTNIQKIALVEKYSELAMVNSHHQNNSQTLHFGDIETNYTLAKARRVKEAADMVAAYLKKYGQGIFVKGSKMVLGVGQDEVNELSARYEEFKSLFPNLKKINRDEIAALEPNLIKDRDPREPLVALYTKDGYTVNFKKLAESFVVKARMPNDKTRTVFMNTEVVKAEHRSGQYILTTKRGDKLQTKVAIFATGPHSLLFARSLGYGQELGILPVAGNFYCAKNVLKGKVYMMQIKKMPFAAIHGDPDVLNSQETRFGPTIRILPLLERHNYKTMLDFLKISVFTIDGFLSLLKLAADRTIFKYLIKNIIYDLPVIGKRMFLQWEVRKIVPALTADKITLGRGIGGIRPQVINTKTRKIELGEAEVVGSNVIFNITPSPGASVCLKNAEQNTLKIISMLGPPIRFEQSRWCRDFGSTMIECRE